MGLVDLEKRRAYQKRYHKLHPNKEYRKAYREKHREEQKAYQKQYRKDHHDKIAVRKMKHRTLWMEIIKSKGMHKCSKCGYEKCFEAIDFHHKDPKSKESAISYIIQRRLTPLRLLELSKCIALCSNCHREEHVRLRNG